MTLVLTRDRLNTLMYRLPPTSCSVLCPPGANLGLKTHIVVCELAHFSIIDTDDLGFFVAAETEVAAREVVHEPENDSGHNEGVGQARNRIGELVTQLDPMMVQPPAWDDSESIEAGDTSLGKEGSQDVANNTADSMRSEDIESIVIMENKLDLSSKIANSASGHTEKNGSGGADT